MLKRKKKVAVSLIPVGLQEMCVPIGQVKLLKKNPRKNDKAAIKLAELIKRNKFRKPIIIDQNNIIVAGNTAYKAAQILGMKEIPVAQSTFRNEAERLQYIISDNKASEFSSWDDEILSELLTNEDLNMDAAGLDEFNFEDFDVIDKQKLKDSVSEKKDNTISIEFLPEDMEIFLKWMKKTKVKYNSSIKQIAYGFKIAQILRGLDK